MNKQQARKNQKKSIEKLFLESFKPLNEMGRAKPPTSKSRNPIVDKALYKKRI